MRRRRAPSKYMVADDAAGPVATAVLLVWEDAANGVLLTIRVGVYQAEMCLAATPRKAKRLSCNIARPPWITELVFRLHVNIRQLGCPPCGRDCISVRAVFVMKDARLVGSASLQYNGKIIPNEIHKDSRASLVVCARHLCSPSYRQEYNRDEKAVKASAAACVVAGTCIAGLPGNLIAAGAQGPASVCCCGCGALTCNADAIADRVFDHWGLGDGISSAIANGA
ncbi:unnamed protein product [Amoebophrya sp. A120]|nr:unnamed protein product [Amoebophrya sp. A120]|eukprot:GSA120T00006836001.1